eukprot:CAMPEP_0184856952 /NCGR_PEP_ID=MMETSP0580-20130426/2120_1 /TAXON_ID=1118495 /ORGANISM="Dactyliosolen fragilissimus" /LENGTH=112 /DNA_ID=CAMNT_0027352263 /DNA_START=180 /DNA_END=518 /DNA_ORIENTATION=+
MTPTDINRTFDVATQELKKSFSFLFTDEDPDARMTLATWSRRIRLSYVKMNGTIDDVLNLPQQTSHCNNPYSNWANPRRDGYNKTFFSNKARQQTITEMMVDQCDSESVGDE